MGLFGDKKASQVELHRVVCNHVQGSVAEVGAVILDRTGALPSAPRTVGKLYVSSHVPHRMALNFGNKAGTAWTLGIDLQPKGGNVVEVRAECLVVGKGGEFKNFLHKTLKPVLDTIEDIGTPVG